MALQSAIAKVGVAKQASKGTAAAAPTYGHGVTDGSVLNVDVQQDLDDLTSGSRTSAGVIRTGVMSGQEFTTRAFPGSIGAYLYGALGAIATTGSGPYTHTITPGSGDLPYLTAFGVLDSNIYSVRDLKVDEIGFSFDGTAPVGVSISGMGTVLGFPASFSPTTDETSVAYLRTAGGTFSVDVDGGSGTASTARITAGEVTISNNLDPIMLSSSIVPDDVFPGRMEVSCSFDIVPDDLALWRTIVTGSDAGTTVASGPVYGSFSIQFTDGTNTLTLAATKVAFTCDFPDADPAGGAVTLSLAGIAVQPSGGSSITATLVNSVATY